MFQCQLQLMQGAIDLLLVKALLPHLLQTLVDLLLDLDQVLGTYVLQPYGKHGSLAPRIEPGVWREIASQLGLDQPAVHGRSVPVQQQGRQYLQPETLDDVGSVVHDPRNARLVLRVFVHQRVVGPVYAHSLALIEDNRGAQVLRDIDAVKHTQAVVERLGMGGQGDVAVGEDFRVARVVVSFVEVPQLL